jgi:hypothetical protein
MSSSVETGLNGFAGRVTAQMTFFGGKAPAASPRRAF